MFLNKPIAYLTNSDINEDGSIKNSKIPNNKPIIIMLQGNFCGYCTKAKPDFQKFADNNKGKVFAATIQSDGKEPDEPVSINKIKAMCNGNFIGYPTYIGKKVNGKWIVHEGGRDVKSLENFLSKLM